MEEGDNDVERTSSVPMRVAGFTGMGCSVLVNLRGTVLHAS